MDAVRELDQLIDALDGAVARKVGVTAARASGADAAPVGEDGRSADAIDRVRQAPGRTTQVRSLRETPAFDRLREEMVAGVVRNDTAAAALAIVRQLLTAMIPVGA